MSAIENTWLKWLHKQGSAESTGTALGHIVSVKTRSAQRADKRGAAGICGRHMIGKGLASCDQAPALIQISWYTATGSPRYRHGV